MAAAFGRDDPDDPLPDALPHDHPDAPDAPSHECDKPGEADGQTLKKTHCGYILGGALFRGGLSDDDAEDGSRGGVDDSAA